MAERIDQLGKFGPSIEMRAPVQDNRRLNSQLLSLSIRRKASGQIAAERGTNPDCSSRSTRIGSRSVG